MADKVEGEVLLKWVRGSFLDILEPSPIKKNKKGEEMGGGYKGNWLIPKKGHPDYKPEVHGPLMAELKRVAAQVKADKWTKNPPKLKADKVFLRDGDEENWDGYANCFYVSSNSQDQPSCVDRQKDAKGKWLELTKQNGGTKKVYAGAYFHVIVRIWAMDNDYGKRLNCEVKSVQFVKHGEAFSGGKAVDPNEKFADDFEDDEDDDFGSEADGDDDDSGLI